MEFSDAYELFRWLEKQALLVGKPAMWWPSYGTFEVVVGAILTQNTRWQKVEHSLQNLRDSDMLSLEALSQTPEHILMPLIQPSGLYKSKARYLKGLSQNILAKHGDLDRFCQEVDREWLLAQKGVGPETADSILCYACQRAQMVVDAYTARLLKAFGLEYESYEDIQWWFMSTISEHFAESSLPEVYALYHGMIVEYVKANSKGKVVLITEEPEA